MMLIESPADVHPKMSSLIPNPAVAALFASPNLQQQKRVKIVPFSNQNSGSSVAQAETNSVVPPSQYNDQKNCSSVYVLRHSRSNLSRVTNSTSFGNCISPYGLNLGSSSEINHSSSVGDQVDKLNTPPTGSKKNHMISPLKQSSPGLMSTPASSHGRTNKANNGRRPIIYQNQNQPPAYRHGSPKKLMFESDNIRKTGNTNILANHGSGIADNSNKDVVRKYSPVSQQLCSTSPIVIQSTPALSHISINELFGGSGAVASRPVVPEIPVTPVSSKKGGRSNRRQLRCNSESQSKQHQNDTAHMGGNRMAKAAGCGKVGAGPKSAGLPGAVHRTSPVNFAANHYQQLVENDLKKSWGYCGDVGEHGGFRGEQQGAFELTTRRPKSTQPAPTLIQENKTKGMRGCGGKGSSNSTPNFYRSNSNGSGKGVAGGVHGGSPSNPDLAVVQNFAGGRFECSSPLAASLPPPPSFWLFEKDDLKEDSGDVDVLKEKFEKSGIYDEVDAGNRLFSTGYLKQRDHAVKSQVPSRSRHGSYNSSSVVTSVGEVLTTARSLPSAGGLFPCGEEKFGVDSPHHIPFPSAGC